ncbi:MAG TPA: tRNA 2-selenouridine(34) synthase MnmH [Thiobacillaceae bacterium]|nr:tRNA 2-selenouridine(34) synthase MnmH [Thiobacillaceae bacterium]HNU63062.1 tRNA 2-selenouridine(34) synthase MnmH [Thiobacillaceae bacterium]
MPVTQHVDTSAARRRDGVIAVRELDGMPCDEIIDVRSPGEYAEDHIPGAINLPVLDDAERARVGTLHRQDSAFAAKKLGAALVSRNIARHLETHFAGKPRGYHALVYCWRGGNRSGSLVTVLRAVGWHVLQLEGGYKSFRHHVLAELTRLPPHFGFRVICGPTGVGKSRFLRALEAQGAQVLDLEELAAHMGSVLGAHPRRAQPSQKLFETRIWDRLRGLDPARPVFVESESRRIGSLRTPESLLARMRDAGCINLAAGMPVRVAVLREEYAHFLADPQALGRQLDCLVRFQGRERIETWKALGASGQWDTLVAALLTQHYDPAYARSLSRNYVHAAAGPTFTLTDHRLEGYLALARQVAEA